jgi:hypothetical protein
MSDVTTLMTANTFHELVIEEFAAKLNLKHKPGCEQLKQAFQNNKQMMDKSILKFNGVD